jgi:DNA gyrase subunit A
VYLERIVALDGDKEGNGDPVEEDDDPSSDEPFGDAEPDADPDA